MTLIEVSGSNSSSHTIGQGNSSTRVFVVDWASRFTFAESLLGELHPDIPFCWCKSVSIEPFPGQDPVIYSGTAAIYDLAKVTAEYGTDFTVAGQWPSAIPKPALRANTTLQLAMSLGGEFLEFPARFTRWDDNSLGEPTGPVPDAESGAGRLLVRQGDITLTWNYVDDPPTLTQYFGSVNSDVFLGAPAETLLFAGVELEESTKASITDPGCWTVKVTLQYRMIKAGANTYGWNHEYRGEDGWRKVYMFDGSVWEERYTPVPYAGMFL